MASLWLAIDRVSLNNGPMEAPKPPATIPNLNTPALVEVLPFAAQPESRGQNMPRAFIRDTGGDTKGFDNFNLSLDPELLRQEGARKVLLEPGEVRPRMDVRVHLHPLGVL